MECPRRIPHGNVSSDCNPDGACAIVCDVGYRLGAVDMRVKCQADTGAWDIDTSNLCQGMSDKYSLCNAYSYVIKAID